MMISSQNPILLEIAPQVMNEHRLRRSKYRRMAQYVTFDLQRDNATISIQPVDQTQNNHYRRFMVATAFKISEALSRLIL